LIGDEIGNGKVDLVADGADHGDRTRGDGARNWFCIERPQVF
jgi:hypothetical protein